MGSRVLTKKQISRIWKASQVDNKPAMDYLKGRGISTDDKIGYLKHISIDETFYIKDAIVFPLFDTKGVLRGLNSRKLKEKNFMRLVYDDYPLIYSNYDFIEKPLVLVESPIDALTLRPLLPNYDVSATLSASLTVQQLTMLSVVPLVITCLDNDEAGQRCAETIEDYNSNAYSVPTHKYEGINDMNDILMTNPDLLQDIVSYINKIARSA